MLYYRHKLEEILKKGGDDGQLRMLGLASPPLSKQMRFLESQNSFSN
jgi:hypothetical protein